MILKFINWYSIIHKVQNTDNISHAHSQIDFVVKYIGNQETHHQKKSFKVEYLEILRKNEIEFNGEYVFDFFDEVKDWE